MKKLILILSFVIICANKTIGQEESRLEKLEMRVSMLAEIVSDLMTDVDSLKEIVQTQVVEFERYKWNLIASGQSWDEVIKILGPPDREIEAGYGTIKYEYGKGYVGYVLLDKEKKVISANPPLYLRMHLK